MRAVHPPDFAQRILSRSISPNLRSGAMGDFEQIFSETADTSGIRAATVWYWREVIRSLPFFIADTVYWTIIMLKNYFHVAYRNLLKNKASSVVNIVGLSLAVASAIVAFLFIERQYTMDSFHENGQNIFLVENHISRGDDVQLRGDTPMPLGPAMQAAIPQVRRAVRIERELATFRKGSNTFQELVWHVDPEFLDVFSFELRLGDKSTPLGVEDIVISDALATKYFADENPIGKELTVLLNEEDRHTFIVKGVAAPYRDKTSFSFDALLHYDHLRASGFEMEDWATTTKATFIEVESPSDIELIASQMEQFRQVQNAANENRPISKFEFAAVPTLSTNSHSVNGDISGGSHPAGMIVLGIVALFMLLLSCINYMNLAVATASRRLREIAVRKAVGGTKGQLITQFLTENVMVCALALGLGFAVAYFLFLPGFNALFGFAGGGIAFSEANMTYLWTFLITLLLVTGLISGAYPAFYISSFEPTAIFKGQTTLGGEGLLSRGLLTFQFVLAFLTMIMGVVMAQNANYQASRDWGYDSEQLLVVRTQGEAQYSTMKTEVSKLAGVKQIGGARNHFSRSWSETTVESDGNRFGAARFDVGADFLEMYDLSLVSGSAFSESSLTDTDGGIVVNDLLVQTMGWTPESAIGQIIREDSLTYTVAGVVDDFVYDGMFDPVEPVVLRAIGEDQFRYMSVKILPGASVVTEAAVRDIWRRLLPDREYNGFFQDEVYRDAFLENTNIKKLTSFIAGLALIIACMGLFGLVAQRVARRMREISIRKALGASVPHLARKVNTSFLVVLVIAAIIATPLGYIGMESLLGSIYADPVPIGPSAFILSMAFVFATATLTIASQVRKFVLANPAEVLRSE
jgi:putative ABC transport system permease protein